MNLFLICSRRQALFPARHNLFYEVYDGNDLAIKWAKVYIWVFKLQTVFGYF